MYYVARNVEYPIPTPVGVNRLAAYSLPRMKPYPHARGGEPYGVNPNTLRYYLSPRPWG